MSKASTFLGGNIPVGSIVTGQFASDPKYLPCDGNDYVSASYPALDKTNLSTWGSNTWTSRTLPTSQYWYSVAFGAGVFVAVGANGGGTAGTVSATSPDGVTWTNRTIASGVYTGVIFAGGQFIAFGGPSGTSNLATSPDGITWTARTISIGVISSIAYGNGIYVAVTLTSSNPGLIATSPDGITWTNRNPFGATDATVYSVTFAEGRFLIMPYILTATTVSTLYHSVDGINWTPTTLYKPFGFGSTGGNLFAANWNRIVYFKGLLIAGTGATPGEVYISRDFGATWLMNSSLNTAGASLTVANGVLFCTARPSSNTNHIRYSLDAARWGRLEMPSSSQWLLSSGGTGPQIAFGANTFVCITDPNSVGANTTAASLAIDTTKFRTPSPSPLLLAGDPLTAERTYIKAA